MLEACFHLTPTQLRDLIFFVDSMGLTWWTFWCLNWQAFGSTKNGRARYPLSHQCPIRDEHNAHAFDRWKCICYFLLTHLPIFGVFSAFFDWNNCEMLFRIGGTFIDLFALMRRDVAKTATEHMCNRIAMNLPIRKPTDSDLCHVTLDAQLERFENETPSPMKKRAPRIDMGTDGPVHFDLGVHDESDSDPDSLDNVDSPPTKSPGHKCLKVVAQPEIKSPLFITPSTRKTQRGTINDMLACLLYTSDAADE